MDAFGAPAVGYDSSEFFDNFMDRNNNKERALQMKYEEVFVTMKDFAQYWVLEDVPVMTNVVDSYTVVHCSLYELYSTIRRDKNTHDIEEGLKKMSLKEIFYMITKINSYASADKEPRLTRPVCHLLKDALKKGYKLACREEIPPEAPKKPASPPLPRRSLFSPLIPPSDLKNPEEIQSDVSISKEGLSDQHSSNQSKSEEKKDQLNVSDHVVDGNYQGNSLGNDQHQNIPAEPANEEVLVNNERKKQPINAEINEEKNEETSKSADNDGVKQKAVKSRVVQNEDDQIEKDEILFGYQPPASKVRRLEEKDERDNLLQLMQQFHAENQEAPTPMERARDIVAIFDPTVDQKEPEQINRVDNPTPAYRNERLRPRRTKGQLYQERGSERRETRRDQLSMQIVQISPHNSPPSFHATP